MPSPQRRIGLRKRLWRQLRERLKTSAPLRAVLSTALVAAFRFVNATNRFVPGSREIIADRARHAPAIGALWHGQHLMGPFMRPPGMDVVALFSRSGDAELNAAVANKLGFEIVRGSGGREGGQRTEKGGARALIALKRALDQGKSVAMIADIPHGTPREAGLGIVTLARLSGRPIVPMAYASSRRIVLEKSWDKTTISLPFGRAAVVLGEPIHVAAAADDREMERKRAELTAALNRATADAYAKVDARP